MIRRIIRKGLNRFNLDLVKMNTEQVRDGLPTDFSENDTFLVKKVRPFTMTSPERIVALSQAVDYLVKSGVEGSFVECGVWKGGSIMAALIRLKQLKVDNRSVYLYDTFEGMSTPTTKDESFQGKRAMDLMDQEIQKEGGPGWCYSTLEEVKSNIETIGYPNQYIHYIKGKVEDTIPETLPGKIALLRLDTDWYESTKHELEFLYPLLVNGGVLIIDDYGHWKGARQAVDEYFEKNGLHLLLNRIDYTGRMAIKP